MPIVIPRTEAMAATEIPQQDRNKLWEQIIRNYAEKHPEIFSDAAEDKAASHIGSRQTKPGAGPC